MKISLLSTRVVFYLKGSYDAISGFPLLVCYVDVLCMYTI